jgi:hypothetical protein
VLGIEPHSSSPTYVSLLFDVHQLIELKILTKFTVSVNIDWVFNAAVDALCVPPPALKSPLGVRGSIGL